jgi:hypothetical protein
MGVIKTLQAPPSLWIPDLDAAVCGAADYSCFVVEKLAFVHLPLMPTKHSNFHLKKNQ